MKNYIKKFSIMLAIALAIIGLGMIYGGSGANAATVGQQLLQPEAGWRRIDDADNGISYARNWEIFKSDGHYYNSTFHNSWSKGNTMVFEFYGTKLRIIGDIYNNKSSNIDIKIDANTDNINEYNSSLAQFQTIVYEKLNLPLATHTVTITTKDNADVVIDALDLDDTGYLMNPNESITLDKSTMNLTQGDSGQLTATTTPAGAQVTWKSSDSSIATVDSTGKVTAAKEGTCTITATTADGLTATCAVTVLAKGTDPIPQPTDTEYITNIAHAKGTNTNNPGGEILMLVE
jgi:uncharacterized protein YjdB